MCVCVCVRASKGLSLFLSLFHVVFFSPRPGKLPWQQREIMCAKGLLKLCIIYYRDLKRPITVFEMF